MAPVPLLTGNVFRNSLVFVEHLTYLLAQVGANFGRDFPDSGPLWPLMVANTAVKFHLAFGRDIVWRSLLIAVGRALGAVHVEDDGLRFLAIMNPVDPDPREV